MLTRPRMFSRFIRWALRRNKDECVDHGHEEHTCHAGSYGDDYPHVVREKCVYQEPRQRLDNLEQPPQDCDDQTHESQHDLLPESCDEPPESCDDQACKSQQDDTPELRAIYDALHHVVCDQYCHESNVCNLPCRDDRLETQTKTVQGVDSDEAKTTQQEDKHFFLHRSEDERASEERCGVVFDDPGVVARLRDVLAKPRNRAPRKSKASAGVPDALGLGLVMDIPQGDSERKRKFQRKAALAFGLAECSNTKRRKVKKSELLSAARSACPSADISHRSLCSNLRRLEDKHFVKTTPQSVVLCDGFDAVAAYEELALKWRTPKKHRARKQGP